MTDLSQSNSLANLAARIKAEHEATAAALRRGAEHAMTAGDLLIEAKAQIPHGKWLPWLEANCEMSERTARLYMRLARCRSEIEAKTATVADLNLRGALALISMPSDSGTIKLADGVAETADSALDIAAFERSNAERNVRKAILDDIEAALQQVRPDTAPAESIWQELGDELLTAIADITNALKADEDVPFATSPQATVAAKKANVLALRMLRDGEAGR